MVRRLRMAMAVLCIAAAGVLLIMWVRSYQYADRVHVPLSVKRSFAIASKQGRVALVAYEQGTQPNQWQTGFDSHPMAHGLTFPTGDVRQYESWLGFGFVPEPWYEIPEMTFPMPGKPAGWTKTYNGGFMKLRGSALVLPYWCGVLVLPVVAVALTAKRPWRFGLRSLLAALSFVAGVLGLAVVLDG